MNDEEQNRIVINVYYEGREYHRTILFKYLLDAILRAEQNKFFF